MNKCTRIMLLIQLAVSMLLCHGSSAAVECPQNCLCRDEIKCRFNGSDLTSIPQDLPKELEELTITRSKISRILSSDFIRYRNLRRLVVESNPYLNLIEPYALQPLRKLNTFQCNNNSALRELHKYAFAGIRTTALKLLLNSNGISKLNPYVFQNSRGLRTLSLRNNPLKTIANNAFTGLYKTDFLFLPDGIEEIAAEAFKNLTRVHLMDMGRLSLSRLETRTFRGLQGVKQLKIQNSKLGVIHIHAFAGIETVEEILILDSTIKRFRKKSLGGMNHVGLLVIKRNTIKILDKKLFKHLSADKLHFTDNKISCTCRNVWLFQNKEAQQANILRENYCGSPNVFAKRSLAGLPRDFIASCKAAKEKNSDLELTKSDKYSKGKKTSSSGGPSLPSPAFILAIPFLCLL